MAFLASLLSLVHFCQKALHWPGGFPLYHISRAFMDGGFPLYHIGKSPLFSRALGLCVTAEQRAVTMSNNVISIQIFFLAHAVWSFSYLHDFSVFIGLNEFKFNFQ